MDMKLKGLFTEVRSKSKYPVSKQIRETSRFINKAVSEFELWLKENDYNVMIDCNEIYKK